MIKMWVRPIKNGVFVLFGICNFGFGFDDGGPASPVKSCSTCIAGPLPGAPREPNSSPSLVAGCQAKI